MFRHMPIILFVIIVFAMFFGHTMPIYLKEFLYSVSISIKSFIVLFLPFVIFSLLFRSAVTLSHGAGKIIGLIIALVFCSNFVSTFVSHYVGQWAYHFDLSMITPCVGSELQTLWTLDLPKWMANDKAMFYGIHIVTGKQIGRAHV